MIRRVSTLAQIPTSTIVTVLTTVAGYLIAFALIGRIVDERKEAGATLAWILTIVFVPYLGALLYLLIGRNRFRRRTRRRVRSLGLMHRDGDRPPHQEPDCFALAPDSSLDGDIARVALRVTGSPVLSGNSAQVFVDADETYDRMQEAILAASDHVHLASYIFRPDAAGRRFRDLLVAKAGEGVEVRLLVDDVGSHGLDDSFVLVLENAGGKFARFMPVMPLRPTWRPNLRNHRKILVVDGLVGFCGGLNIGEEYQGRKKKFAPWRDTHMRIEGPAVWRLQEIFCEDWHFAADENLLSRKYYPDFQADACPGKEMIQVVESGPDKRYETIRAVLFSAINAARKNVYITTPYFIPDDAMLLALKVASWRGVDVRILLPGKSDLLLVKWAGRSYYRELLEAGIRLYEHRPGILHAKTMAIDGSWATVGSANLDIRSFRLNFEVNVLISGRAFAARMEEIFASDLEHAHEITTQQMRDEPRLKRFTQSVCRVLSPVL